MHPTKNKQKDDKKRSQFYSGCVSLSDYISIDIRGFLCNSRLYGI